MDTSNDLPEMSLKVNRKEKSFNMDTALRRVLAKNGVKAKELQDDFIAKHVIAPETDMLPRYSCERPRRGSASRCLVPFVYKFTLKQNSGQTMTVETSKMLEETLGSFLKEWEESRKASRAAMPPAENKPAAGDDNTGIDNNHFYDCHMSAAAAAAASTQHAPVQRSCAADQRAAAAGSAGLHQHGPKAAAVGITRSRTAAHSMHVTSSAAAAGHGYVAGVEPTPTHHTAAGQPALAPSERRAAGAAGTHCTAANDGLARSADCTGHRATNVAAATPPAATATATATAKRQRVEGTAVSGSALLAQAGAQNVELFQNAGFVDTMRLMAENERRDKEIRLKEISLEETRLD